jgi:hypothetical protein
MPIVLFTLTIAPASMVIIAPCVVLIASASIGACEMLMKRVQA